MNSNILPVRNREDAVGEPTNKLAGKLLAVFFCEVILLILIQPTIDPLIDLPIIFRSFTDNLATKCTSPARGFEAIISEKRLQVIQQLQGSAKLPFPGLENFVPA